uniref:DZIP3-like HEPN domain-containing protein n=1 Tax=Clytia hemisphaerica TaxID=252671 RepID=A0A7M6DP86_9CNID
MGSQFSKIVGKNKEWTKCIFALTFHGKMALLQILHDPAYQGLPVDEKKLYQFFLANKTTLDKLLKKNILKKDQYDLLLPPGKQETSSKLFDITLLALLIRNFVNIPKPQGGWGIKEPKAGDTSIAAFVILIRELRNQIVHGAPDDFLKPQHFQNIWAKIR